MFVYAVGEESPFNEGKPIDFKGFLGPYEDTTINKIVSSICNVLVAFSF